jgi:hypothetical protein
MAATGLIAADHAFHERPRQNRGGIGNLLSEVLAGLNDLSDRIFHHLSERYRRPKLLSIEISHFNIEMFGRLVDAALKEGLQKCKTLA